MAFSDGPTLLTQGSTSANGSSATTASISPLSGVPIYICLDTVKSGTPTLDSVTGLGLTWELVDQEDGNSRILAVYRACGVVTPGTVTINVTGTMLSFVWYVFQWVGADPLGTAGSSSVVQFNSGTTASVTSVNSTLTNPLARTGNAMFVIVGRNVLEDTVPDADFTEPWPQEEEINSNLSLNFQWALNQTACTSTWATSGIVRWIAVEIAEETSGATTAAIREGEGIRLGFVLAIEGYEYILTDSGLTAPVVTAWVGTGWTQALTGLEIRGQIKQAIEPWQDTIEAPRLTFAVQPDENDTFGIAVWKTKPSFNTRLDDVFEPGPDGSGTLTVKQTTGAAASGRVYLGGRAVTYESKGGTSFAVTDANTFTPFQSQDSNRYAPSHSLPSRDMWDVGPASNVQDVPKTWIGKKVALYVHRIRGTVWDSKSNAQLEFAGRIREVSEDDDGKTVLECEDLRADIRDAVLSFDQWTGVVKRGIYLIAGTRIWATEWVTATTAPAKYPSAVFTVVASGASGVTQANAGYYSIHEFVSLLDAWLEADATLTGSWSTDINTTEGGLRTQVHAYFSGSANSRRIALHSSDWYILEFLGWTERRRSVTADAYFVESEELAGSGSAKLQSPSPPYRLKAVQGREGAQAGWVIDIDSHTGTWLDHSTELPSPFKTFAAGANYSFVDVGGALAFGKLASATQISNVDFGTKLSDRMNAQMRLIGVGEPAALTVDDPDDVIITVKQVVVLGGAFAEIMPRLFASVNGLGTNHEDYDVYKFGAGIPWSLLGDDFVASCRSLEQAVRSQGMMIVLEKPRKFLDVLMSEMALRFAWLIFKDGVYQFVSPPTPSAVAADHDLTELNKASADGNPARTGSVVMDQWLRNVIKVEYNRSLLGEYRDSITIRDSSSIDDYGESQAVTIKATNSYADAATTGASVEDLLASLVTRVLPALGKPCKVITRSISPSLYHVCPGDTVTVSDDYVRDPLTGVRGLSSRPGIILSVNKDWGQGGGDLFGEVTILISDEDRTFPIAPAGMLDWTYNTGDYDAGYDSVLGKLMLVAKTHQRSAETALNDIHYFDAGDLIRIIEVDPADPAAPVAWDRVIGSLNTTTNEVTLTATLSSPAFNAALRYRVVPQLYSAVQSSQKLHTFIADNADALIEDLAQPNLYGDGNQGAYTRTSLTVQPSLIPWEAYVEGRPLHAGLISDLGGMLNNLVSYKTAPNMPMMLDVPITSTYTVYVPRWVFPFYVGGAQQPGTERFLKVGPRVTTSAVGGSVGVRVTSSAGPPLGNTGAEAVWSCPKAQVTFTSNANPDNNGVEPAVQDLPMVTNSLGAFTWITVELLANSTFTTTFFGLSTFYMGPIEYE